MAEQKKLYTTKVRDLKRLEAFCEWLVDRNITDKGSAMYVGTLVDRMVSMYGYSRSGAYRELTRPGFVHEKVPGGIKVWFDAELVLPEATRQGSNYYPEDPSVFLSPEELAVRDGYAFHMRHRELESGVAIKVPLVTEVALAKTMSGASYLLGIREELARFEDDIEEQKAILRTAISALSTYYMVLEEDRGR